MWAIIKNLLADGTTILLTTQYLDEADQLADRIAVIDRGVKVAQGTPDELKASVGRSTLQLQLVSGEHLPAAARIAEAVLGELPVLTPEARRMNIALQRSDQAVDVLIALREQGLAIESMTVQKPSLDEVFLALTGHDTGEGEHAEPEDPSGTDHLEDLETVR
jgi:ABC-2 type transport system ATP-binding protein